MAKGKGQNTEDKRLKYKKENEFFSVCFVLLICLLPLAFCLSPGICAEKWQGVDESVVEKYAKEHGREAAKPLINIDQGDLPLFLFLLAGTVGGFAAGYYWRKLTEAGDGNKTTGVSGGPQK